MRISVMRISVNIYFQLKVFIIIMLYYIILLLLLLLLLSYYVFIIIIIIIMCFVMESVWRTGLKNIKHTQNTYTEILELYSIIGGIELANDKSIIYYSKKDKKQEDPCVVFYLNFRFKRRVQVTFWHLFSFVF